VNYLNLKNTTTIAMASLLDNYEKLSDIGNGKLNKIQYCHRLFWESVQDQEKE
jgi:hypothetical protein